MHEKVGSEKEKVGTGTLILWSAVVGVASGSLSAFYRYILGYIDQASIDMYAFVSNHLYCIPFLFAGLIFLGVCVGKLIARFHLIGGSGVPQVKVAIDGHIRGGWSGTILAKMLGGMMSSLGGLAIGRAGPSMQLGACVAEEISNKVAPEEDDRKIFLACGASAGLTATFHTPLASILLIVEELYRKVSPIILITMVIANTVAYGVTVSVFGVTRLFALSITSHLPWHYYGLLILLGVVTGVCGSLYNVVLLKTPIIYKKMKFLKKEHYPVVAFLMAGVMGLLFPITIGAGSLIAKTLTVEDTFGYLFVLFWLKFAFSMISATSGTPGGIFFPFLVLGAMIGGVFGKFFIDLLQLEEALFNNFMMFAMAGFFTAIVRTPFTSVILVLELTGDFTQIIPIMLTSVFSYLVATKLKSVPIYNSLHRNLMHNLREYKPVENQYNHVTLQEEIHL